jgi:hypothetical protein
MVTLEVILRLINTRVARLLDVAELALPSDRFLKFRKLTLDEFGRSGLERELERLFKDDKDRHG